ncbi:serine/threonine-protein kinase bud32 [Binucleata daphniae]
MTLTLLSHGAEAKVYRCNDLVVKYRLSKSYRLPEIDKKLIEKRTKSETAIINKLHNSKIYVPKLHELKKITNVESDKQQQNKIEENLNVKNTIVMQYIDGISLKDYTKTATEEQKREIYKKLGVLVQNIHNQDVIHGDITTLNFIIHNNEICAIDFGLSYISNKDENKAVDLYVFERAAICSYGERITEYFYEGYQIESVLKKLVEVRRRGRKREESAIG